MVDPATKRTVRESWRLAKADSRALTKRFYGRLFEIAPGVQPLFPEDMRGQRRKLADTLDAVVSKLDDLNTVIVELTRLGERHVDYGAQPEHYPVVGDALLWALQDQLGDDFTPECLAAWTEVLGVASSVMIDAQATVSA